MWWSREKLNEVVSSVLVVGQWSGREQEMKEELAWEIERRRKRRAVFSSLGFGNWRYVSNGQETISWVGLTFDCSRERSCGKP